MKSILKGEKNYILALILSGLLFFLWGRLLACEIDREIHLNNLDTLFDRIHCIESFGWQIDYGSELCEKIKIPTIFDDVWQQYNKLQLQSGFDLSGYKGEIVTKYTYIITNPPENSKDPFYANILVYEKSMIGGDVFTTSIDGLMMPIRCKNE